MSTYTQRLMSASYDEALDMIDSFNNDELVQAFEAMIRLHAEQTATRTLSEEQQQHLYDVKHRMEVELVQRMYES